MYIFQSQGMILIAGNAEGALSLMVPEKNSTRFWSEVTTFQKRDESIACPLLLKLK